jgi:cytochrome P450
LKSSVATFIKQVERWSDASIDPEALNLSNSLSNLAASEVFGVLSRIKKMKTLDTFSNPDGWPSAAAAFADDFSTADRIQAAPWGGYAILGHAELLSLSRNPAVDAMAADTNAMAATPVLGRILDRALFTQSGPLHRSERGAMIAAFASLKLQALTDETVNNVMQAAPERADLRTDLIERAVRATWAAILGLSLEDAERCEAAVRKMAYLLSPSPRLDMTDVAEAGAMDLNELCKLALHGSSPFVASLQSSLGADRAVELLAGIAFDGIETIAVGIDAAMRVAFANCGALQPTARCADECLRLASPTPLTMRYTTDVVEICDIVIEPGTPLAMVWAAGNHDPDAFPEPAQFSVERASRPLTFGMGHHACLGHALSRSLLARLLMEIECLHPVKAPLPERWRPLAGDWLFPLRVYVRPNSRSSKRR